MQNKAKELILFPVFIILYYVGVIFLMKFLDINVLFIKIFMLSFVAIFYAIRDFEMEKSD